MFRFFLSSSAWHNKMYYHTNQRLAKERKRVRILVFIGCIYAWSWPCLTQQINSLFLSLQSDSNDNSDQNWLPAKDDVTKKLCLIIRLNFKLKCALNRIFHSHRQIMHVGMWTDVTFLRLESFNAINAYLFVIKAFM